MHEITQTTSIKCSRQDLLDFFAQPLPLITLDAGVPSLLYHIPQNSSGEQNNIKWSLYHGLYHIKWTSTIQEYKPLQSMKSSLSSGPLSSWNHTQQIEMRGLKIYIHDKISFECDDDSLTASLKSCILRYQFEVLLEEKSKKVTQKIHAIQQKIA